jgi:protein-tyrosine phosphatase
MRILFVCMGNICRSPTAEAVMRGLLRAEGLEHAVTLDSAGTGGWHAGAPPDARAVAAARSRGIVVEGAARQVTVQDFDDFDLLLVMDRDNERELRAVAPDGEARAKVRLLREFDPAAVAAGDLDVPDPYYGGPNGFDRVLDLVEAACRGLLDEVRAAGPA